MEIKGSSVGELSRCGSVFSKRAEKRNVWQDSWVDLTLCVKSLEGRNLLRKVTLLLPSETHWEEMGLCQLV